METFRQVIDAFGGAGRFGHALGIPNSHARTMRTRDSIPAERWARVVAEAAGRGIAGITLEALAAIAARRLDTDTLPPPAAEVTAQDEEICP